MKKEKAAFKLYSHLAKVAPSDDLKNIFTLLAKEEANHKLHFEQEYDEFVLREN
jgi:rubrerythrin